jgi:endonuclease YncB( thermonuclease family)
LTLTLNVDLGFFVHVVVPFRIVGINARELAQPGGPEARDHLAALLPAGTEVTVASLKPDKFGSRWDAAITCSGGEVAAELVATQWAAAWDGTGTKPVPPWPRDPSS